VCGITGLIDPHGASRNPELKNIVGHMADTLLHRGPDDGGVWGEGSVALGHRRLSIVDLSPEGRQPMFSSCGRYVLVFNGEIYNHREIRQMVDTRNQISWRGHSDTEVMLAAFTEWGVRKAVELFAGMFAFALWDRKEKALFLGRDRLGEKPIYYGMLEDVFLFGSELKSLRVHPKWRGSTNPDALKLFLSYGYVPAPHSIYQGIFKILPGTIVRVASEDLDLRGRATPSTPLQPYVYWSAKDMAESSVSDHFQGTVEEAVDNLDLLLRKVVAQQMVADVPLGAFLSGGVDSSCVVALMQAQSPRPVKTFTIGFYESGFNEAEYSKAVARHLGTEHTELYVTSKEAHEVVPRLAIHYDEPFADPSQIPTCIISQLTRRYVTVSLSGDGGDELFGGYGRYIFNRDLWRKVGWVPRPIRQSVANLLSMPTPDQWERVGKVFSPFLKKYGSRGTLGDKFHKVAEVLSMPDRIALYYRLLSQRVSPEELLVGGNIKSSLPERDAGREACLPDFISQMMYLDLVSYLPDDCLVKVDRASMAASLESRAPFLDHRVVEFAWRLPLSMKVRNGEGKWLLKQVLDRYVPRALIERPKKGFSVPIAEWLRGPLREWGESLLNEYRMRNEGFFNVATIQIKWREHLAGQRNWDKLLWHVLMFQAWLEAQR
jgi:asparagine synthase (glutamine-hydrolysing)